jgi:hypothetical protein
VLAAAPDHDYALPGLPEQLWPVKLERLASGTLYASGPPNARFRVVLAAANAPPQQFGRLALPLANDAVFRASVADERLEGHLDADGHATILLPPETAKGARYVALAVLHDLLLASTELNVRGIAGPMKLE